MSKHPLATLNERVPPEPSTWYVHSPIMNPLGVSGFEDEPPLPEPGRIIQVLTQRMETPNDFRVCWDHENKVYTLNAYIHMGPHAGFTNGCATVLPKLWSTLCKAWRTSSLYDLGPQLLCPYEGLEYCTQWYDRDGYPVTKKLNIISEKLAPFPSVPALARRHIF